MPGDLRMDIQDSEDDISFDVTIQRSLLGEYFSVVALTFAGKEGVEEVCPGIEWEEGTPPDEFECLWYSGVVPRDEEGIVALDMIDQLAAQLLELDLMVGLLSGDGKYCTAYILNEDGTASVLREQ
jgi:hypothetical protein